jgi:catechol 2,3-dioxygenase-like lactoylglutathione lyase family enzyme
MRRVIGIGGVFFKARDPEGLAAWYQRHLGITPGADGYVTLPWREPQPDGAAAYTAWTPFPAQTGYFAPSEAGFMINYRVADLPGLLAALEADGIEVLGREDSDFGRFAWILDPEGTKLELWEPPASPDTAE